MLLSQNRKNQKLKPNQEYTTVELMRRFYPHIKRERKIQFAGLILLMLLGAAAELISIGAVIPFVALMANPEKSFDFPSLQSAFSMLGWKNPESVLVPITILFALLVITAMGLRLVLAHFTNRFVYSLGYDVGMSLYERVLRQPYSFHISKNTSEILAGINKVQNVVNSVLLPLLSALISVIVATAILIALLVVDSTVTLISGVLFLIFYFVVVNSMRRRLRSNSRFIAKSQTKRIQMVQEGLGGIRHVILDNTEQYYLDRFSMVDQQLRKAQASNAFIAVAPRYMIEAIGTLLIVGLAFILATTSGGLLQNLPMLGALALGAQRLLPLFQQIYNGWSQAVGNRQVFVDVLEMLSLPVTREDEFGRQAELPFYKHLELKDIFFRYGDNSPWVLEKINLLIPKGSKVGFIGKTGSGKTTLVDIVMGLLRPTKGEVLIDGIPIADNHWNAWRRQIAHVPQMIYLADASVAENIALGVPEHEIDHTRLYEAAKKSQAEEFIETLPQKYQTRVGEQGVQLSGGQRQRIAIARALYKHAQILVFDEATSALDNETENAVMSFLKEVNGELTILVVAHRLTSLKECDLVVRIEHGKVIEQGDYELVIEGRI